MKRFKYRRVLIWLIALLLLLPTGILVTSAIAVGNFPREGEADSVRVIFPSGEEALYTAEDPLYGAVHDLLTLTDRVSSSALPKNREVYLLDFTVDGVTERVKLYLANVEDKAGGTYLACFVLSSEDRLYRVKLPGVRILTRVLTPSRADWLTRESGETEVLYTYSYSENKDAFLQINLSSWDVLASLSHDSNAVSEVYSLYDGDNTLLAKVGSPAEIAEYEPARVIYTVRWSLLSDAFLESTYVFGVGE